MTFTPAVTVHGRVVESAPRASVLCARMECIGHRSRFVRLIRTGLFVCDGQNGFGVRSNPHRAAEHRPCPAVKRNVPPVGIEKLLDIPVSGMYNTKSVNDSGCFCAVSMNDELTRESIEEV